MNYGWGSSLAADILLHRVFVENVIKHLDYLKSDKRLWREFHNFFVAYCVLFLKAGTGHRMVHDLFCYWCDFNLYEGFVLINDKCVSRAHHNRLVWLSDILVKQIEEYKKHLHWLCYQLRVVDKELSGRVASLLYFNVEKRNQSLPVFFFIDDNFQATLVCQSSLERHMKDFWPYVHNVDRHSIESYLSCERPLIDEQLGHISDGRHPLGAFSGDAPMSHGKELKSLLTSLLQEQGWKLYSARERCCPYRPPKIIRQAKRVFGPELRAKKRMLEMCDLAVRVEAFLVLNGGLREGSLNRGK